jgi:hypothetical protein
MQTLKYEEVYRTEYRNLAQARAAIGEFLEKGVPGEALALGIGLPFAGAIREHVGAAGGREDMGMKIPPSGGNRERSPVRKPALAPGKSSGFKLDHGARQDAAEIVLRLRVSARKTRTASARRMAAAGGADLPRRSSSLAIH